MKGACNFLGITKIFLGVDICLFYYSSLSGIIHNCAIFFFWTLINENDIKIIEAAKDLTVSQSELVLCEPCPVLWDSLRISSGQKGINSVNSKKFGK